MHQEDQLKAAVANDLPQNSSSLQNILRSVQKLVERNDKQSAAKQKACVGSCRAHNPPSPHNIEESTALETRLTQAVYDLLQPCGGAEILHASCYQYADHCSGTIDGVVVGKLQGRHVMVLCVAKPTVLASINEAMRALQQAKAKVLYLSGLIVDNATQEDLQDYGALRVSEFGGRDIVFALGGTNLLNFSKVPIQEPWLAVPLLQDHEQGIAELQPGRRALSFES